VLVLGAGGAARAAAQAIREIGAHLLVSSRRDEQAQALAEQFSGQHILFKDVGSASYQVLVNCTPAGGLSQPGSMPLAEAELPEGGIVIDANYRPLRTPLLMAAQKRGNTPIPGGEWFVRQAMEQFKRFTHKEPDQALMRATFEHAYDEDRRQGNA
jgi:shikimate 5-dehydrogenase